MARNWLVDCKGFARKVKGGTLPSAKQPKDCGANRECPNCRCLIDNRDVSHEWPGLPVGVKFDPSDMELLEHLAAKCGVGNSEPHMFIDEFIPTLDIEEGICYKHPEELPGSRKDGSSVHFFHRTVNAYSTGQRKRRKIHSESSSIKEKVRWHKTGKTKAMFENGIQKGWKKIMVLYGASVKGSKPEKSHWVMHQYHLGTEEDEKEGQYVVSKIFYQSQKADKTTDHVVTNESDVLMIQTSPRTPKTNTPHPPRPGTSELCDDVIDDGAIQSTVQDSEVIKEISHPSSSHCGIKDDMEYPSWLAGESQDIGLNGIDDGLLCDENFGTTYGFGDFENLELDTPPDFQLSDLQFCSQDSIFGW